MSAYLGNAGRLIPIYSTPNMDTSGIPSRSFKTTLEGKVKAQVRLVGRRVWSVSAEYATPDEVGNLLAFASGEWGNGPFLWIPPSAPSINVLTPSAASCAPEAVVDASVSVGGPMALGGGQFAGRSFVNSAPATVMHFGEPEVPVRPGTSVTGSAYVLGTAALVTLWFYRADGSYIERANSPADGAAAATKRLSVTAVAPADAALCRVSATDAFQGARPAVTWTQQLTGWGTGEGCLKAVVEAAGRTALFKHHSNLSFSIREVG